MVRSKKKFALFAVSAALSLAAGFHMLGPFTPDGRYELAEELLADERSVADHAKGLKLLGKAASAGQAHSATELGRLHTYGFKGAEKNLETGRRWLEAALEKSPTWRRPKIILAANYELGGLADQAKAIALYEELAVEVIKSSKELSEPAGSKAITEFMKALDPLAAPDGEGLRVVDRLSEIYGSRDSAFYDEVKLERVLRLFSDAGEVRSQALLGRLLLGRNRYAEARLAVKSAYEKRDPMAASVLGFAEVAEAPNDLEATKRAISFFKVALAASADTKGGGERLVNHFKFANETAAHGLLFQSLFKNAAEPSASTEADIVNILDVYSNKAGDSSIFVSDIQRMAVAIYGGYETLGTEARIKVDFRKSFSLASKLYKQNTSVMLLLARMNMDGRGTEKDLSKARELFEQCASREPECQYWLSMFYESGLGIPKDRERALEWLEMSAKAGFVPAMLFLAESLLRPEDGPTLMHSKRDVKEAKKWLEKAAAGGSDSAKKKLALLPE